MPATRHCIAIVVWVGLLWLPLEAAGQVGSCTASFTLDQWFPTTGSPQTRWEVSACSQVPYGLVIGTTRFSKSPGVAIQVSHDLRVSDIFVPYHDGSQRFYDISEVSTGPMILSDLECPPEVGTRLAQNTVCRELRDRGLAWKDASGARRGEELVLWSIIDSGNYKYVIEWRFRDDGIVVGRVGATGRNLSTAHHVGHTHSVTWRLDVDLNGPAGDSVRVGAHVEPTGSATADDREWLVGVERGIAWNPLQFTTLNISDATLVNGQGKRSAYILIPLRSGTARHLEAHSRNDFWVTRVRTKGAELSARDLPSYISPAESVSSTDIVVWYTGSIHHIERDEDDLGPTHLMWIGFELKPHDLFDRSPLYP